MVISGLKIKVKLKVFRAILGGKVLAGVLAAIENCPFLLLAFAL